MSNKIKIVVKKNPEPFTTEMVSYINTVREQLALTDVNQTLINDIELQIRSKTKRDCEEMYCDRDWEVFRDMYIGNAHHIISNLKRTNEIANNHLIDQVNNGNITPETLVNMTPDEMYPQQWESIINKKLIESNRLMNDPEATTELFTCPRCGRNKCRYFERQDRSADEPKTVHITCCFCGKRWRK